MTQAEIDALWGKLKDLVAGNIPDALQQIISIEIPSLIQEMERLRDKNQRLVQAAKDGAYVVKDGGKLILNNQPSIGFLFVHEGGTVSCLMEQPLPTITLNDPHTSP